MSAIRHAAPGPDEVHVWWIDLPRMPDDVATDLTSDERDRADRFRRPADRMRWMGARAALRQILAKDLGVAPASVAFDRGSVGAACRGPTDAGSGKPALRNDPRLRFNLAHAGDRAVLAVAWEREVGVDLEPIDPGLDLPPLLTVACTPAEIARIEALPPDRRIRAFLTLWTVKEAYLKAIGVGMFREPRTLEVEFLANRRAIVHDAHEPLRWAVRQLDAGPGWVAALALGGELCALRTFIWPIPPHAPS